MSRWYGFGRTWVVVDREVQGDTWVWVLLDESDTTSVVFATQHGEDLMVSFDRLKLSERLTRLENTST
jgi:hypothetical protein